MKALAEARIVARTASFIVMRKVKYARKISGETWGTENWGWDWALSFVILKETPPYHILTTSHINQYP